MKFLNWVYLITLTIVLNSCSSKSTHGDQVIIIEQLDLKGDFSLADLKERIQTRQEQTAESNKIISDEGKDFKGYDHIIKEEKDVYEKAPVVPYDVILPKVLGDKKRGEIYACADSRNPYYDKINVGCNLGSETFNNENGLIYIGKAFYSVKDNFPYSQGKGEHGNSQSYGDDASGPGLIFVRLYELGLENPSQIWNVLDYNFLEKAAIIGRIEVSIPHKDVVVREITLDIPDADKIHEKMNEKGFYKYLFDDKRPEYLREKYYALTILINHRILVVVTLNNENYAKFPKEFDSAVKSCKAIIDGINYELIISLSTPV